MTAIMRCTAKKPGIRIFLVEEFLAIVGAIVCGTLFTVVAAFAIGAVSGPLSTLRDRMVDSAIFRWGADSPWYLGPVLCALMLGWLSAKICRSWTGLLVPLVPLVVLALAVSTWKSYSTRPNLADAWANFFTQNCGESECIAQLLVTQPAYTSLAYTLGWIFISRLPTIRSEASSC